MKETGPSDIWPPKPAVRTQVVRIADFSVTETPDRLTITRRNTKRVFAIAGAGILFEAAVLGAVIAALSHYNYMPVTAVKDVSLPMLTLLIAPQTLILGLSYMIFKTGCQNRAEPLIADRAANSLRVNRQNWGCLSDVYSVVTWNIKQRWGLTIVLTDPDNPEERRPVFVIDHTKPQVVQQLAQIIVEFAGVPVETR